MTQNPQLFFMFPFHEDPRQCPCPLRLCAEEAAPQTASATLSSQVVKMRFSALGNMSQLSSWKFHSCFFLAQINQGDRSKESQNYDYNYNFFCGLCPWLN